MNVSQTSQFVVEIKEDQFVYGSHNRYSSNSYGEKIIKFLNENFETYKKVNQNEMVIPIGETIAFNWIISNLKNKNVKFILSEDLGKISY